MVGIDAASLHKPKEIPSRLGLEFTAPGVPHPHQFMPRQAYPTTPLQGKSRQDRPRVPN